MISYYRMNDKIRYFFSKVWCRIRSEKNLIWECLPVEKISLWGVGRVPSKDEFVNRLHKMFGEFSAGFFNEINPHDRETIVRCADQSLNHDFDLLGSGLKHFDKIPWHSDFKSGYEWPKGVYYRKLPKAPAGTDLKMPRELSRCHQLLWCGEAFLITKKEKYAREVVAEIDNWIDENPLMYSVNWECAMDVAIRAVNWMYALNFIAESNSLTGIFTAKVYKSLFQHAFFIRNNLEKTIPCNNNHYMSDIVGLLHLGRLFGDKRKGKRMFRFAFKEYCKETLIQIMPSGVNFERSVSYHRLTSELLLYSYYMLNRCGVTIPKEVDKRLNRMTAFIANYTKANGLSPTVADNDDGRLAPFVYRDFRQHAYLTNPESTELSVATKDLTNATKLGMMAPESRCYQDANVMILRKGDSYLFTSCCDRWKYDSSTGAFVASHLHNDLLSFEYSIGKDDFIVDPGAYLYTSDVERHNEFRSNRKHNTVMIDDEEQNFLSSTNSFALKYNCNAKVFDFFENAAVARCEGEYTTICGKMTHRRRFELTNKGLTITDSISKQGGGHSAYLSFHLAEDVLAVQCAQKIQLVSGTTTMNLEFETKQPTRVRIFDDTVSPSFGVLKPSKTISVFLDFDDNTDIVTKFSIIQ